MSELDDGVIAARRQPLRWHGQAPEHLVQVVWQGGRGEPIDAQGVCICGWRTPIYDQYASFGDGPPAAGRVADRDASGRATREALEHGGYDRLEHERQIRQLAAIVAEQGLKHRAALEEELSAYDRIASLVSVE